MNNREINRRVLVLLAHGAEEMEAVIIIDMLRRAGLNVIVAGQHEIITCSRGVKILPDYSFEDLVEDDFYEAIILPGGAEGVHNLLQETIVEKVLRQQAERNGIIAAICTAPALLAEFSLLPSDAAVTGHPSIADQLNNFVYMEESVVIDKNFITSRGAGTAFDFALTIIDILTNAEKAEQVAKAILYESR